MSGLGDSHSSVGYFRALLDSTAEGGCRHMDSPKCPNAIGRSTHPLCVDPPCDVEREILRSTGKTAALGMTPNTFAEIVLTDPVEELVPGAGEGEEPGVAVVET